MSNANAKLDGIKFPTTYSVIDAYSEANGKGLVYS